MLSNCWNTTDYQQKPFIKGIKPYEQQKVPTTLAFVSQMPCTGSDHTIEISGQVSVEDPTSFFIPTKEEK